MSSNTAKNNGEGDSGNSHMNDAIFEAFFKQYFPRLCVYCKFKYGFDIEQAEDIISRGFIKLWEVRHTLAADVPPTSYLYKIIDNQCLNILKHNKIKKQHLQHLLRTGSEEVTAASFESIDLKQLRTAIDLALSELPEQMRRIFELSRVERLKYTEIAARLDISVKTVETQMSRALQKLRIKLSEFLPTYLVLSLLSNWIYK